MACLQGIPQWLDFCRRPGAGFVQVIQPADAEAGSGQAFKQAATAFQQADAKRRQQAPVIRARLIQGLHGLAIALAFKQQKFQKQTDFVDAQAFFPHPVGRVTVDEVNAAKSRLFFLPPALPVFDIRLEMPSQRLGRLGSLPVVGKIQNLHEIQGVCTHLAMQLRDGTVEDIDHALFQQGAQPAQCAPVMGMGQHHDIQPQWQVAIPAGTRVGAQQRLGPGFHRLLQARFIVGKVFDLLVQIAHQLGAAAVKGGHPAHARPTVFKRVGQPQ